MLAFYLTLIDDESDRLKFERVYNTYYNILLNLAFSVLGDRDDAEDAMHEAFLRLTKSLDKIDEKDTEKTKGFLVTVVRNVAKTMLKKRNKCITLENADDLAIENENVESEVSVRFVAQKIAQLPEAYRDILLLQYRYGCTGENLGKMLGISASAARKRLQRAREMLGEMLNEE